MSDEKKPLADHGAERTILGAMLTDPESIIEFASRLVDDDFYVFANGLIFRTIVDMADAGMAVDVLSVGERLGRAKKIDEIGGLAYLAGLLDTTCRQDSGYWAQLVASLKDYAKRRHLVRLSAEIRSAAMHLGTPIDSTLADTESRVLKIGEIGEVGEAVAMPQAVLEVYNRFTVREERGEDGGVPTGFVDLDSLLCGFHESELIVVGARPSVGKTAFCLSITRHVAVDLGIPMLFISLEQSRVELTERLLCGQGRVNSRDVRRGVPVGENSERIMQAGDAVTACPLLIDDACSQNMHRISANVRRLKKRHGIRLVIVDYIQLVQPSNERSPRQEQVSDISRRLKLLARDVKLPVIVAAQLNRGVEDRTDKRPRLSDLRESGAIEQDSDTVLLLHRETNDASLPIFEIDVIVAKQRNGPTGEAKLAYHRAFMRFENLAQG